MKNKVNFEISGMIIEKVDEWEGASCCGEEGRRKWSRKNL